MNLYIQNEWEMEAQFNSDQIDVQYGDGWQEFLKDMNIDNIVQIANEKIQKSKKATS